MAIQLRNRMLRRAAVLGAAACVLATAACSGSDDGSASASSGSSSAASSGGGGTYLALGDSVPFGYRGHESPATYGTATNFVGYPELAGKKLGLDVVNASCPGETTASFLDATAQSNGCENSPGGGPGFRTGYPLHVPYESATQSQLDLAVRTLKDTDDVQLVTLMVGANDGFLCQATTADKCTSEIVQVASTVQTNVTAILTALRDQGGYDGKVVVVSYYALNYADPTGTAAIQLLDAAIAAAAKSGDATVASGFDAFSPTAQKSGGDSIAAGLVLPDDVHPTAQGQQLLADAVTAAAGG
jgi:lysophospholipase L1-like esterase